MALIKEKKRPIQRMYQGTLLSPRTRHTSKITTKQDKILLEELPRYL